MLARLSFALLLLPAALLAQERKDIFADPQNLKVLPADISSADLRNTMRGFALGLGVRCETCHVGEPGQPLETFDFASDDKDTKQIARQMLKMVNAINSEHIGLLDHPKLQVQCLTCHRGVQRPATTAQVLGDTLTAEGVDAAAAKYQALRDQYYGTHSYDFSESVLSEMAQGLARSGDAAGAMSLLVLNDRYFPDSFQNHWLKGEVASIAGDEDAVRENFEKALAIGADPRSEAYIRQKLEALEQDQ